MYLRLTDVVRLRQQLDKQENTINCNIAIANLTTSHEIHHKPSGTLENDNAKTLRHISK